MTDTPAIRRRKISLWPSRQPWQERGEEEEEEEGLGGGGGKGRRWEEGRKGGRGRGGEGEGKAEEIHNFFQLKVATKKKTRHINSTLRLNCCES